MSEPLLKVENVAASYGSIVALKSVSLEVYEGEIVTIVGANGAGKTTLLSCISGLMPYKGSIAFKGEKLGGKIDSAGIVERGVIQVPEGRQIFSDMTVHENLLMGAYSRKKGDNIQPELDEVYELFPGWQSAEIRRAEAFPVVSSRCWQWDGRSWQSRSFCCWTNLRWVLRRSLSTTFLQRSGN